MNGNNVSKWGRELLADGARVVNRDGRPTVANLPRELRQCARRLVLREVLKADSKEGGRDHRMGVVRGEFLYNYLYSQRKVDLFVCTECCKRAISAATVEKKPPARMA